MRFSGFLGTLRGTLSGHKILSRKMTRGTKNKIFCLEGGDFTEREEKREGKKKMAKTTKERKPKRGKTSTKRCKCK
jgi:hypothetical protein